MLSKCELQVQAVVRNFETKIRTIEKLSMHGSDYAQFENERGQALRTCMDQYSNIENEVIFLSNPLTKLYEHAHD